MTASGLATEDDVTGVKVEVVDKVEVARQSIDQGSREGSVGRYGLAVVDACSQLDLAK